jgi:hypothetical protein
MINVLRAPYLCLCVSSEELLLRVSKTQRGAVPQTRKHQHYSHDSGKLSRAYVAVLGGPDPSNFFLAIPLPESEKDRCSFRKANQLVETVILTRGIHRNLVHLYKEAARASRYPPYKCHLQSSLATPSTTSMDCISK